MKNAYLYKLIKFHILTFVLLPVFMTFSICCEKLTGQEEAILKSIDKKSADVVPNIVTKISHNGITWYFAQGHNSGKFANGDYWVTGPVTIIGITPISYERNGHILNGSQLNPSPHNGSAQGYDSYLYGHGNFNYDEKLNVARPDNKTISSSNPLCVETGSIVSSISIDSDEAGLQPQLESMSVLTILNSVPQKESFRPPYCGLDKTIILNKKDLDYALLETFPLSKNIPDFNMMLEYLKFSWIDHIPDKTLNKYFHHNHMPENIDDFLTSVCMGIFLSHAEIENSISYKDKVILINRLVQLGLDNHRIVNEKVKSNICNKNDSMLLNKIWSTFITDSVPENGNVGVSN